MTRVRLFFVLLYGSIATALSAQIVPPACPFPPPPPAESCWETCVYCFLDGYMGINDGTPSGGNTVCGQISIHNDQHFAFTAGTTSITFELLVYNCQNGDGLQLAIFSDCSSDALACNPGAAGNGNVPVVLAYHDFVPGQIYYLMIDGWTGDVCEYELTVINGSVTPPPSGQVGDIEGPAQVCPGATVTYSVVPVPGASYYQWSSPPGSWINGGGNTITLPAGWGEEITVTFGNTGGQVCVTPGSACYAPSASKCKPVSVSGILATQLPPLEVYFEDLPYVWEQDPYPTLSNPGTYNLTSIPYTSYLGCDSTVKQTIVVRPPMAAGIVFYDFDGNGVYSFGDQPVENAQVVKKPGIVPDTTLTGADGWYRFFTLTDTIRLLPPYPGAVSSPDFHVAQFFIQSAGYDFAVAPPPFPDGYDLDVDLTNLTVFRQGFPTTMILSVKNDLADPTPFASTCLVLPYFIDFISSNPAPDYISGDTICWSVGVLDENEVFNIKIKVETALGTPNNKQVSIPVWVVPQTDDQNPDNNFYVLATETDGSFDPNDKQVQPAYVTPAMLAEGEYFEYTIRFQNTGTYPADFVRIIDTLSAQVDAESFRFEASSHPCTWNVSGEGVVDVFFEDIQLPDSSSNEAESHGFVKFAVKPAEGLALGDHVLNFCDIYFDFNDPVRTNTAGTQVVYFIPGEGFPPGFQDALKARPNPASYLQEFTWLTPAPEHGVFRYIDILGLPHLSLPVEPGWKSLSVDVTQIPNGTYLAVLESGGLVLHKLVIVQHGGGIWLGNN